MFLQTASHHAGSGGGGTLEVLYEDPKEDLQSEVLSILSCGGINDDDKRQLIEEMTTSSVSSEMSHQKSTNINIKLNGRNIFSRFANLSNLNHGSNDENVNAEKPVSANQQKTEDEIILDVAWGRLDEEIRDIHHLINEFSQVVS